MKKFYFLVIILAMFASGVSANAWYNVGIDITNLANWWSSTTGTGTHPANFTTAGDTWTLEANSFFGGNETSGGDIASLTFTIGSSAATPPGTYTTSFNFNGFSLINTTYNLINWYMYGNFLMPGASYYQSTFSCGPCYGENTNLYLYGNLTQGATSYINTDDTGTNVIYFANPNSSFTNPQIIVSTSSSASTYTYAYINSPAYVQVGTGGYINTFTTHNFTVNTGGNLIFDNTNVMSGTAAFTNNGTIYTQHPQGLSTTAGTGSIQTTGTKTFNAGTYVYDGTSNAQVIGNALGATINAASTVIINNTSPAPNNIVSLSQSENFPSGSTLTMSAGRLGINGNTLTLAINPAFSATNSLSGSSTSNLTLSYAGAMTGLYFDQTTPGTTNNIATLSFGAAVTSFNLNNPLQVSTDANFTTGGIINLNGNTLILNGTVVGMSTTKYFTGNSTSNLIIGTTGALGTFYMNESTPGSTNNIATLTINGGGSVTLGNNLNIGTQFNLTSGSFSCGTNTITVTGPGNSWVINGTFNAGSGNVIFNNTTPTAQTIGGTANSAFYNLNINNNAGVSLGLSTTVTGTLQLTNGILNTTPSYSISTPGISSGVTGGSATSYVKGTLMKSITGCSSILYQVGDTDYAPVNLTLSSTGTAGSIGLMSTFGLHPDVATSGIYTSNIANHYWTIINSSAAGPATVLPKATYNPGDIIGAINSIFVTQKYSGSAWLGSPLATTNTSSPYTSAPNSGIALSSLAGSYIFGNSCSIDAIIGISTLCLGSTTTLADGTTGGTWSSGTTSVATISSGGIVTPISTGISTIVYSVSSCATGISINVVTTPTVSAITGPSIVCVGAAITFADVTAGGTWSVTNSHATISSSGIITGISSGTDTAVYTVATICGTVNATHIFSITSTLPTISAGSGTVISYGGSATLTATGGSTYTWSPPGTLSVSTGATVIASPTITTTYTVTGTASSGCSNTAEVTVTVLVPCGIPSAISTSSITLTSAIISWSAVSSGTEYELAYKTSAATTWTDIYTTATAVTLTGLDSATYYDYEVRTVCAAGDSSAYAAVDSFNTLSSCGTPTAVITSGITTTSVIISWAAISHASTYLIAYQPYGASTWTYLLSTTTSRTITGLTPGTAYNYKVTTICGSTDTSISTSAYTFATLIACTTPAAVTVSSVTSTSAIISWSAVTGASGYVLAYKVSVASSWTDVYLTTTSRTLTGLSSGTIYDYQVRSVCGAGDSSSYSSPGSFTTLGAAPPCSTPTGLTSVLTSTVAVLSWGAVSGAYGYQVEYQLVTRGTPTYAYTTTNSIALTGLSLSSSYEYKVRSVCAAGDTSSASPFTTFRLIGDGVIYPYPNEGREINIFPNPTQDKFTISYHLDEMTPVSIIITNTLGQTMAIPTNNEQQEEGDHNISFTPVTSGLFIVRIMIGNHIYTEKVVRY